MISNNCPYSFIMTQTHSPTLIDPFRFSLLYIVLVGALVDVVVTLSVALGVVVSTDDDAPVLDEQPADEGGDRVFLDTLVEGE
jgi:hypothetical protein